MAMDIAKLAIEETAKRMAENMDREMAEKVFGIRFIVDPSLDKTLQDCQKRYSDSCLYFAPLNSDCLLDGSLGFADPHNGKWHGDFQPATTIKAIPCLPEKSWHNELVRLCDQSAKGITVHVASEAQLDSVRETAKRLRRPDIVFQVAPSEPKSDEIEKI